MFATSKEAKITLALEAFQNNRNLSLQAAAKIYNVSCTTLAQRRDGRPTRRDSPANSRKLIDLEKETIVQYVIELDTRAFLPRLYGVEDITYIISEWIISASGSISYATRLLTPTTNFLHHTIISAIPVEAKVVLALEALEKDSKLSLRAAAKIYSVPYTTLYRRRAGRPLRRDTTPNSKKLTQSKEEAIVQYVIELDIQAFPPRLYGVEDMAN